MPINVLQLILQQSSLEVASRCVNQVEIDKLLQSLPTLSLTQRILVLLLLEKPKACYVFNLLEREQQTQMFEAMEISEKLWLLEALETDFQDSLNHKNFNS
ncbi:hypothetical protein FRE64_08520 [Euhalothece natronophila Z-M001]|uniref:Magnesium transporter MgtE intracellular domain-containing protein n=1 Tax=Euhalothece natronophila Z-M001 TaxID=522448 RepID=A0A5B8NP64_9CHRO|nr:hypothetical protein [Euhalothece natronophila]QDZ39979.1 hypothetical protein FRE64_08520 [Euhalothece natronophila Z-M001]